MDTITDIFDVVDYSITSFLMQYVVVLTRVHQYRTYLWWVFLIYFRRELVIYMIYFSDKLHISLHFYLDSASIRRLMKKRLVDM